MFKMQSSKIFDKAVTRAAGLYSYVYCIIGISSFVLYQRGNIEDFINVSGIKAYVSQISASVK